LRAKKLIASEKNNENLMEWSRDWRRYFVEMAELSKNKALPSRMRFMLMDIIELRKNKWKSKGNGPKTIAEIHKEDEKAVKEYNGKELDGREVRLDIANSPNKSNKPKNYDNKPRSAPSKTVFIGNLSWNTSEQKLSDMFGEYGNIISIRIPTEKETGRKKGFGYVEFDDVDAATKALELSGTEVDGRNICLDYAPERNNGGNGGNRVGNRRGNRRGHQIWRKTNCSKTTRSKDYF
jgi:nucleolin